MENFNSPKSLLMQYIVENPTRIFGILVGCISCRCWDYISHATRLLPQIQAHADFGFCKRQTFYLAISDVI